MASPRSFSCALITGASAGLGEEFALQLAPRVDMLVLVARRENRMQDLADSLRARYPRVAVAVYAVDLSDARERRQLRDDLEAASIVPDLLINNAGVGDYGEFATSDWSKLETLLRLNMEALAHLTHLLLPAMIRRGGAIVNVSSLASLLPIPDFAVYAASKAFVTSFSEALRIELREHQIPVVAVCPGPVRTEFGQMARRNPDPAEMPGARAWFYVPKEQVVREAIRGLERDVPRVYPGLQVTAAAVALSILPLALIRLAMKRRPRRIVHN